MWNRSREFGWLLRGRQRRHDSGVRSFEGRQFCFQLIISIVGDRRGILDKIEIVVMRDFGPERFKALPDLGRIDFSRRRGLLTERELRKQKRRNEKEDSPKLKEPTWPQGKLGKTKREER